MYFVNRSEIETILNFFDDVLSEIKENPHPKSKREIFALERMAHIVIEAIIDVGNRMIDGFIMRDPGSYIDIIDILIDEKVIPETEEKAYKRIIHLRKMIVQSYMAIDQAELETVLEETLETMSCFSTHIRSYLNNELGVANAFSNENK